MKPSVLDYVRVSSVDHALATLAEHGDDGKLLAGGQSLVPMLNLRLASPSVLVDIGALNLRGIHTEPDALRLGALVTHRQLETRRSIRAAVPLLADAARHIGHTAIRQRGTIGGSLAHADPTAELALVAVALDAEVVITGLSGARTVSAGEFFLGAFTTVVEPGEMVTEVRVPVQKPDTMWGFHELSRRSGDFALAAAACVLPVDDGPARARVVVAGATPTPLRLPLMEREWANVGPEAETVGLARQAVAEAAGGDRDWSEHRWQVLSVVVADALADAARRSSGATEVRG